MVNLDIESEREADGRWLARYRSCLAFWPTEPLGTKPWLASKCRRYEFSPSV